jgi:hypothetical protein
MIGIHCGSGSNFIVRNNTFVGYANPDKVNQYNYYGTARLGNYPFYNNVVVGVASGPASQAAGNIVYYSTTLNTSTNKVIVSGSVPDPGTFKTPGVVFAGSGDFTLAPRHGRTLNDAFKLAPGSVAIDYGDPANAPATDLLGNPRSDGKPDAGCFEYSTTGIPDFVREPAEQMQVTGRAGKQVYSITGKHIGPGHMIFRDLEPGVYLVKAGNSVQKMIKTK